MSEKRKAYGVYLIEGKKETLIFSDEGTLAVYEKCENAGYFKREMDSRWGPKTLYEVKEVAIEVITSG